MNKSIKRISIVAFCLLLAMSSWADDDIITIVTTNGETSYSMEMVHRIDFVDNGITVVMNSELGNTYSFSELKKIVFDMSSSAIQKQFVADEKMTLFVPFDGNSVYVNGWEGGETIVKIYNTSGAELMRLDKWNGTPINISSISKGIYVIKVNNKTAKFRK